MGKILLLLWIALEKKEKKPLGDYYTYRKMNPYNPLSYVFIIIAIPILIWQGGYKEAKEQLRNVFKWQ